MNDSDATLIERWRTCRDADAFAEIVSRHSGMVYGTCKRVLRSATDAEDAAQECFIELMKGRVEVRSSLAPWLHVVALRRSLDRVKSDARRQRRERKHTDEQGSKADPESADLLAHVDECIAELPETLRTLLIERFFEGKTHAALAETLGVSESTIRHRLNKGVEQVREALKRKGVEVTTTVLGTALGHQLAGAAPSSVTAATSKLAIAGSKTGASSKTLGGAAAWIGGQIAPRTIAVGIFLLAMLTIGTWSVSRDPQPPDTITENASVRDALAVSRQPRESRPSRSAKTNRAEREGSFDSGTALLARGVSSGGVVSGQVYDGETNKAIPGVVVQVSPQFPSHEELRRFVEEAAPEARTDNTGRYQIADVSLGEVVVSARPDTLHGYRPQNASRKVTVHAGQRKDGVDFRLVRGLILSGTVIDVSGAPISEADVHGHDAESGEQYFARSGPDGTFQLAGLAPSSILTTLARKEELVASEGLEVDLGENDVGEIVMTLVPGGSISGTLFEGGENRLPDWRVIFEGSVLHGNVPTGRQGEFRIAGLAPGVYGLSARKPQSGQSREPTELLRVEVGPRQSVTGVRLVCHEGPVIFGRVTDEAGAPVPFALVSAQGTTTYQDVRTSVNGEYRLAWLEEEGYDILVVHPGFSAGRRADVRPGTDAVDFILDEPGTIVGRAVDGQTLEPIPAFEIGWVKPNEREVSEFVQVRDPEGRFTLENVSAGATTIAVRAPDFAPQRAMVENIRPGEITSSVEIRLERGVVLEGIVINEQGRPVADAAVFVGEVPHPTMMAEAARTRSDGNGAFRLDELAAEPTVIFAHHPGFGVGLFHFAPGYGHVPHATITLPRLGTMEGMVRVDGAPRSNMQVQLSRDAAGMGAVGMGTAQTDQEGRFHIAQAQPGPASVHVALRDESDPPQWSESISQQVIIDSGGAVVADFDFASGSGTVQGTVNVEGSAPDWGTVTLHSFAGAVDRYIESYSSNPAGGFSFLIEQVPPGTCTLNASIHRDQGNNWRNAIPIVFDIEDGETVRRDFVFSVGGTVTGHHLDLETGSHLFVAVLRGSVVVTEADPEWSLDTFQQSVVGVAMATPFQIDDVEPGNHTLYVRYHPDPHTQPRYLLEGITVRAGEETYVELEW